jgi:hypothetical protein
MWALVDTSESSACFVIIQSKFSCELIMVHQKCAQLIPTTRQEFSSSAGLRSRLPEATVVTIEPLAESGFLMLETSNPSSKVTQISPFS